MFRRCVMSHGRRLMTTASSCEHQTSHMISPPLKPYKQLLVSRSLSTAPNHEEDRKGSFSEWMKNIVYDGIPLNIYEDRKVKDPGTFSSLFVETYSGSFNGWMKNIYDEFIRKKKEYKDMKYVHKDERRRMLGYLKYDISGFRGANDKSMTVEIRHSRQTVLVVSGRRTYKSGRSVVIERHITLPTNNYSEAKKRATFNSNMGFLVVEISDFKEAEDIKIEVEKNEA